MHAREDARRFKILTHSIGVTITQTRSPARPVQKPPRVYIHLKQKQKQRQRQQPHQPHVALAALATTDKIQQHKQEQEHEQEPPTTTTTDHDTGTPHTPREAIHPPLSYIPWQPAPPLVHPPFRGNSQRPLRPWSCAALSCPLPSSRSGLISPPPHQREAAPAPLPAGVKKRKNTHTHKGTHSSQDDPDARGHALPRRMRLTRHIPRGVDWRRNRKDTHVSIPFIYCMHACIFWHSCATTGQILCTQPFMQRATNNHNAFFPYGKFSRVNTHAPIYSAEVHGATFPSIICSLFFVTFGKFLRLVRDGGLGFGGELLRQPTTTRQPHVNMNTQNTIMQADRQTDRQTCPPVLVCVSYTKALQHHAGHLSHKK